MSSLNWTKIFVFLNLLFSIPASSEDIPEPESWSFPQVVDSARKLSPKNLEGKAFNEFGLAYSREELSRLNVSRMTPEKLQKYADVVTHAYPDAVGRSIPCNCSSIPIETLNETSVAGIAFVSLNAIEESTRQCAKACLIIVQSRMQESE